MAEQMIRNVREHDGLARILPWNVRMTRLLRSVAASACSVLVALTACAHVRPPLVVPKMTVTDPAFVATMEAYTNAAVTPGNRVDVLLNGDQIFPAQVEAIRSARKSITYAQYFYEDGRPAVQIVKAISERCRAGIRARVLLDAFGSMKMPPELTQELEQSGCYVTTFRPLTPWTADNANNRNHRRILVVDARTGFTGGSGASSKWMGDGRQKGQWRETDVRVEGPAVNDLQGAFAENWLEATGEMLGGDAFFAPQPSRGSVVAQVVRSSPASGSIAMYNMYLLALSSARRNIFLTNPYFLPDERMAQSLVEARGRGVKVVLLLPGAIDNNIVRQASRAGFGKLFDAGVEIYEYQPGLLHAKTLAVDGVWATVGSANVDNRSFALNEELNVALYDAGMTGRLEKIFTEDVAHSRRVDETRWRSRGPITRLLEWLSIPLRGQL
jgi:cardiolipin synthase